MPKCDVRGCTKDATVLPHINVWATTRKEGLPSQVPLSREVCPSHSKTLRLDDLVPTAKKEHMSTEHQRKGKVGPDWTTAKLDWIPLPKNLKKGEKY